MSPVERHLRIEPPAPVAVRAWAAVTDEHCRAETETEALIRDLQQRTHRLECLVRAYGMKLQAGEAPDTGLIERDIVNHKS